MQVHGITLRESEILRFWSKVEKTDGCWLWIGAKSAHRYGHLHFAGMQVKAHRFSWQMHFGAIPDGMEVCHRCDVGICVRPDHLFLGTHKDNMNDRDAKCRLGRRERGEDHHEAKLCAACVVEIRRARADGVGPRALGRLYGVHRGTILRIVKRETWAHVP